MIFKIAGILLWILLSFIFALFFEWFDRKLFARFQNRVGPQITGYKGILQPLADFIKLLKKESIFPKGSNIYWIKFSAISSVALTFFILLFIPLYDFNAPLSFNGDLILLFGISILIDFLIIITGYFVASPYSNEGAARKAEMIICFEIPFGIALATIIAISQYITIRGILVSQFLSIPLIIFAPLSFIAYLFSSMAKIEKIPFDAPNAESEIVAGWSTEISGRNLALFRLSSDLKMFFVASFGAILFLGGPVWPFFNNPGLFLINPILNFIIFFIKISIIMFLMTMIRSITARYRIDQVINFFWKVIIPLSMLNLILIIILMWVDVI
jgi:NADH-quinone oxidoreductase subunit H